MGDYYRDRHFMMFLNSVGLVQGNTRRKEERICYGIASALTQINEKSGQTWLAGNYD
jgi:hypothetical protein